jgi:hypothetical protein
MSLVDGGGGGDDSGGPTRKTHIKRIYKNDDPDTGLWVDIERIDELTYTSGVGFAQQTKVWTFDWSSFDPNGDGVSKKKIQDPNDNTDPDDPDAAVIEVPVRDQLVVTQGTGAQYQQYTHFFANDASNSSRETHSRRVYHYDVPDDQLDENKSPPRDPEEYLNALGDKDDSQYLDVEILDAFSTNENENRDSHGQLKPSVWQEKKWLVNNTGVLLQDRDGDISHDSAIKNPADGVIDPPWRLDPLQNIVNLQMQRLAFFVVLNNALPFQPVDPALLYFEYINPIGGPGGPIAFKEGGELPDLPSYLEWKYYGNVTFDDTQKYLYSPGGGFPDQMLDHETYSLLAYNNPDSAFYESLTAYRNDAFAAVGGPVLIQGYVTPTNTTAPQPLPTSAVYFTSPDGFNWTKYTVGNANTALRHSIEVQFQSSDDAGDDAGGNGGSAKKGSNLPVRIICGFDGDDWVPLYDSIGVLLSNSQVANTLFLSSTDNGKTWTQVSGPSGRASLLYYSPSNDLVYALTVPNLLNLDDTFTNFYLSSHDGQNWIDAGASLPSDAVPYGTRLFDVPEPIVTDPTTQFSSCYNPRTGTTVTIDNDKTPGEFSVIRVTKDGTRTAIAVAAPATFSIQSVVFGRVKQTSGSTSSSDDSRNNGDVFIAVGGQDVSGTADFDSTASTAIFLIYTSADDGLTWRQTVNEESGDNTFCVTCSGVRMKTRKDQDGNLHVVSG